MLRKLMTGLTLLAVLVATWSVGGPVQQAEAATITPKCAIIKSNYVGNINWTRTNAYRVCQARTVGGVGGYSYLTQNKLVVMYNESTSSTTQISKTTVHELTHFVEYKTTPWQRKMLYAHLGVWTNGTYSSIPTASAYNLTAWKANPRERLAESVVQCRFGTPSFTGMALVPKTRCSAFIATLNVAIASIR